MLDFKIGMQSQSHLLVNTARTQTQKHRGSQKHQKLKRGCCCITAVVLLRAAAFVLLWVYIVEVHQAINGPLREYAFVRFARTTANTANKRTHRSTSVAVTREELDVRLLSYRDSHKVESLRVLRNGVIQT